MNYSVRVVTEEEYEDWLDDQRAAAEDRPPVTAIVDDRGLEGGNE
jgi:heme/copper-type cytochrome/quinol oxidase subunit 2